MRATRTAALALALLCLAAAPAAAADPDALVASTVCVKCGGGQGTGAVYERGGRCYVLTAAHVVPPKWPVTVRRGAGGADVAADVVLRDAGLDFAILKVPAGAFKGHGVELGADAPQRVGARIYHVGFYQGRFPDSFAAGRVAYVGREVVDDAGRRGTFDQADLTQFQGSSGGPIYDKRGKWVGFACLTAGERVGFFVPLRSVRARIDAMTQ